MLAVPPHGYCCCCWVHFGFRRTIPVRRTTTRRLWSPPSTVSEAIGRDGCGASSRKKGSACMRMLASLLFSLSPSLPPPLLHRTTFLRSLFEIVFVGGGSRCSNQVLNGLHYPLRSLPKAGGVAIEILASFSIFLSKRKERKRKKEKRTAHFCSSPLRTPVLFHRLYGRSVIRFRTEIWRTSRTC